MIILSIGSNLASNWGSRMQTLNRAIAELENAAITVVKRSAAYCSPPMKLNSQKNHRLYKAEFGENEASLPPRHYININLIVETSKNAAQLLYCLKQIEQKAGRQNGQRWADRVLDMDIIDYKGVITGNLHEQNRAKNAGFLALSLPHPGLSKRLFVLQPLLEIAPFWHHPITGKTPRQLLTMLK